MKFKVGDFVRHKSGVNVHVILGTNTNHRLVNVQRICDGVILDMEEDRLVLSTLEEANHAYSRANAGGYTSNAGGVAGANGTTGVQIIPPSRLPPDLADAIRYTTAGHVHSPTDHFKTQVKLPEQDLYVPIHKDVYADPYEEYMDKYNLDEP